MSTGVPEIDKLHLQPDVAEKALQLRHAAPGVVFTSGRRTVAEQAHAMATNVAVKRHFIQQTYVDSPAIRQLQHWVDSHPEARSVSEIAAGLEKVMNSLSDEERLHISKHLTGRAFDVKPHSVPEASIRALDPVKFLTHEAGLERWHVQF
jgi:hypothetical protein